MLGHEQTSWQRLLAAACWRHAAKGGWHLTFPQGFLQARTVGPPDLEAKVSARRENPNHGEGCSDEGKAPSRASTVWRAGVDGQSANRSFGVFAGKMGPSALRGEAQGQTNGGGPDDASDGSHHPGNHGGGPCGGVWHVRAEVQTAGRRPRHRGSTMLS
jgi:hypothetical protein